MVPKALSFDWTEFSQGEHQTKDPKALLTSRVYWVWLCAQYFSRTAYLIGIDKENCLLLQDEIKLSLEPNQFEIENLTADGFKRFLNELRLEKSQSLTSALEIL